MAKEFRGVDKVLAKLRKEIAGIEGRVSRAGMIEAGELVRRESIKITPVDTTNLKGSTFVRTFKGVRGPSVVIGYTASYAAVVHERTHAKSGRAINYGSPRAESKFLEKALFRNQRKILSILKRSAKV